MNRPVAVLISDVHYNLNTLKLADAAMRMAINKANELGVPLIVAGDLHDTKANMRAECVNALIETFKQCNQTPYIIVGNHDRINEKALDHSLNFLRSYSTIVDTPLYCSDATAWLMPYYHDPDDCRQDLIEISSLHSKRFIMHQGIQGSDSGEYIQDKSAVIPVDVAGLRVISGHYHRRQTIDLPDGGKWDYIGNPYTQNFAEANDPPKGFQILMSDGSLEFVPTNLRKHVVFDLDLNLDAQMQNVERGDLLWVKVSASKKDLNHLSKGYVAAQIGWSEPFRLDLIPTDTPVKAPSASTKAAKGELLDQIIDSVPEASNDRKERLKAKWRSLVG